MITGFLALLFLIPVIVGAENGQWGTVAVFVILIVLVLAFGSASREHDRAYGNFVDYWANRDEERSQPNGRRLTQRERKENTERFRERVRKNVTGE